MIGNLSTVVWIKVPLQVRFVKTTFLKFGLDVDCLWGYDNRNESGAGMYSCKGSMLRHCCKNPFVFLVVVVLKALESPEITAHTIETWLILPVVICLSQRLSHACLSINTLYCETANGSLNQL
jgi:hypothetical protein